MSRVISDNKTISSSIVGYDESNHAYYAITNATNGYHDSSNTSYASVNLTRNSSAETYVFWEFELEEIPAGATINSITCNYKARTSNSSTSYINQATIQLYSGTTAKGSSKSILSTSTSASSITTPGTWTAAEINAGVRLRTYAKRGTSRTTSNYYIYFYGADISITYTYEGTAYEITASSNVSGVTIAPATQEIMQGGSGSVTVNSITDVVITDNGTDVTSSFVQAADTISAVPESQTNSGLDGGTSYVNYAVGYSAENPNSSNGNMYASSGSTGYVDYAFDFSDIPSGATINSVEVKAYGKRENSSTDSTHMAKIGLYSGSTLKSTEQEFTSTSMQTITISNPGTWTRAELQSAKLRFTVAYYGGAVSGITWKVSYEIDGYQYTISNINADHVILVAALSTGNKVYIKRNGSWVEAQNILVKNNGIWAHIDHVYKKANNSWTEQDKSAVFDNDNTYLKG